MRFLTTKEVCNLLRIHETTIYKWCKEDKFPKPLKIDKKKLWLYSDIEQFIESKQIQIDEEKMLKRSDESIKEGFGTIWSSKML